MGNMVPRDDGVGVVTPCGGKVGWECRGDLEAERTGKRLS